MGLSHGRNAERRKKQVSDYQDDPSASIQSNGLPSQNNSRTRGSHLNGIGVTINGKISGNNFSENLISKSNNSASKVMETRESSDQPGFIK